MKNLAFLLIFIQFGLFSTINTYAIYREKELTDLAGTVPGTSRTFIDPKPSENIAVTYFVVGLSGGALVPEGSVTAQ